MEYLLKRSSRYYFRLRVPRDLLHHFPVREIRKSLRTANVKNAKLLCRTLSLKADKVFTLIRSGMLTEDQIRRIVTKYIADTLREAEENRALGIGIPKDDDELSELIESYEDVESNALENLAYNKISAVHHVADWLLKENSLSIKRNSPQYKILCRELLKGIIDFIRIEKERFVGNYRRMSDVRLTSAPVSSLAGTSQEATPAGKLLSEVISEYIKEKQLKKTLTPKTAEDYKSTFKMFQEILQVIIKKTDVLFNSIDKQTFLKFVEILSKLPANASRRRAYKNRSLEEVLRIAGEINDDVISLKTRNKKVETISSLFKWAVKQGYAVRNVAEGLTAKGDKKEYEERDEYDAEDLKRIFSSALYTTPNISPERYWIPLIALYSGMRLEEICQLYVEDIRNFDGVLCFDINSKGDKNLKTASSERIVPIHPLLIEIGFMKFIESLRRKGSKRVWENLEKGKYGYGKNYGKQYQRFNRKYITKNKKRVFHSFRHNFTNNLKQKGVADTVISELVGHSLSSITMGRYGKRYQPKKLLEAIKQLDYGINLKHLIKANL